VIRAVFDLSPSLQSLFYLSALSLPLSLSLLYFLSISHILSAHYSLSFSSPAHTIAHTHTRAHIHPQLRLDASRGGHTPRHGRCGGRGHRQGVRIDAHHARQNQSAVPSHSLCHILNLSVLVGRVQSSPKQVATKCHHPFVFHSQIYKNRRFAACISVSNLQRENVSCFLNLSLLFLHPTLCVCGFPFIWTIWPPHQPRTLAGSIATSRRAHATVSWCYANADTIAMSRCGGQRQRDRDRARKRARKRDKERQGQAVRKTPILCVWRCVCDCV
jgi:hypothetical protein